jgi:hypothetical protein
MELKLKSGLEDELIYLPFEKRNVVGKFIDKALYPYMYSKYPNLFDVITPKEVSVFKASDGAATEIDKK